jgi:WD40 repeat protein
MAKMLGKETDQRYQSIPEVLKDLKGLVEDTGWRGRPLAQKIRSRWPYLTISGGAVVILAAAYWTYQVTWPPTVVAPVQRTLTQFTFDEGLQMEPSWSPDGSLLAYASNRNGNFDIWVQSEEGDPIQITKNPNHDWQPDWSPNGKHLVFRSERDGGGLFVIPATGGEWIPITDGKYWADKAVWAPDGTIIYYVSNRGGFFNVWGRRFDPAEGRALGTPFQVTELDSPSLRIDPHMTRMEIGVSADRLALQLMEVSGNIWVLEKTR